MKAPNDVARTRALALRACAVAGLVLLLAGPSPASASGSRLSNRDSLSDPVPMWTPFQDTGVNDRMLPGRDDPVLLSKAENSWGGIYTTSNGQRITMLVSDLYGVNEQLNQGLAEWISKYFFYGQELSTAVFVVLTHAEIAAICGEDAAGCYSPGAGMLVLPGEHYPGLHFMTVWSHEYGHHVAANRNNSPWAAVDWGTKRWASHAGICQRVATGTAFPGATDANYARNPGEVFAESYAQLVNRNGNWAENWWPVWPWLWDPSFTPDTTSLGVLQRDVLEPWSAPEASSWTGTLKRKITWKVKWVKDKRTKKRRKVRTKVLGPVLPETYFLDTGNDGILSVALQSPQNASLVLTDPATGAALAPPSTAVDHTICGQRSFVLRVVGRTPGAFSVSISKP